MNQTFITEETAQRLAVAVEGLAKAIEMQGLPPVPGHEQMSEAERIATLQGPEGLRAYNRETGKYRRGKKKYLPEKTEQP